MTGVVSVSTPLREVRGAGAGLVVRAAAGVVLVLCTAVSVGWLALGAVVALVQYRPSAAGPVLAAAAAGDPWARAVVEAAPASEPLGQAIPDYAFSLLNLVLAGVLLVSGRRGTGARTWPIRLLAVALVGSAGAFNLQAHAAARAIESATGLAVGVVHQVVLHGVACAAYILALLVFPTPSWDGLPGGRSARRGLIVVGSVTFLLVGLGTALLPHTVSCVLFFGFLVPAVGLVVLPRRVRRGPGAEARIQARLLFSTLVGGFAVATVLGVVTLLLWALDGVPGLAMVDPTTHGAPGEPVALLFWFSRLASAAIAVVVLVATRHDGLWTAERWFSRGLAVLLVTAVAGGGCVVLRTLLVGVLGTTGATAAATVVAALGLSPLYVRAEQVVDRLLYGTRPAPYRVLADIAALSQSTLAQPAGAAAGAPDLGRVAEAVALGLGAGVCRLTVRRPRLRDRTYEWTDRAGGIGDDSLVEVPIRHGAEQVGALAVDRQAVSGLNAQRDRLLVDIADGLGVVLEASRSGIELERQLRAAVAHAEEIAVSRRRTVAEMDGERRRIERDLHDGAQHHLVSLRLTLGLVEHQVGTGAFDQAREWLGKLHEQLENAEAVLAATADGVSSLVLAEKGLVAALAAELDAAHPPIGFDDGGIPAGRRFPAEVEAAVWFCCAEAVGNARKHAGGAPITVRLAERAGALAFTVRDEGPGFTPDPGDRPGRGLRNMTTRVSTVGGTVVIRSMPGGGTTVEGEVPLPSGAPVAGSVAAAAARVAEPLTVRITTRTFASPAGPVVPAVPQGGSTAGADSGPGPVVDAEPVAAAEPEIIDEPGLVPEPEPASVDEPEAASVDEPEPVVVAAEPVTVESAPAAEPAPASVDAPEVGPRGRERRSGERSGRERPGRLAGQVRELVRAACAAYRGGAGQDRADALAARLDEPVRIGVLATVDDGRRMLVEALVGTAAVPRPSDEGDPVPVRYVFGNPGRPAGPDPAVVAVPAPALRAMTLVDVPGPDGRDADPAVSRRLGPAGAERMRAMLAPAGGAPVADAFVLLLHYGRPADLTLLDLLDAAGYRGAIGVLAVADDVDAVVERAVREYGDDPAVRRVCHSIVPVAPATAAAVARLGDIEHRWLRRWVAAGGDDVGRIGAARIGASRIAAAGDDPVAAVGRGGARRSGGATTGVHPAPDVAGPEVAAALLDRLGPLGARRAVRLVRSGEGATRAELATALVRHSGLGHLQELIASRFLHRAEALRTRSVLAGLDALLETSPPPGDDARRLRYQLEQVRAGAHELREIEFLDVLRSGDLRLPVEQLRAAERLLGADGGDVRARLGLTADAPVEQVRAVAAEQPGRWRALADHPVASTRVREFAQVLVRTCERLAVEADDDVPVRR